jgi:hypothetical protein
VVVYCGITGIYFTRFNYPLGLPIIKRSVPDSFKSLIRADSKLLNEHFADIKTQKTFEYSDDFRLYKQFPGGGRYVYFYIHKNYRTASTLTSDSYRGIFKLTMIVQVTFFYYHH